jgi:UDP-N-acetylmuramoylalanine--D-glutamate ligase
MGLGLFGGGTGAAKFWASIGSTVTVTDLRSADELAPSIKELQDVKCKFVLGEHRKEDFLNADVVVVNPAVKPSNEYLQLATEAGALITTEIGTAFRMIHGPLFGVTGSNGKSTTTSLLGHIIKCAESDTLIGGNIGGSLLQALKTHRPGAPVVMELSSFQLYYLARQRLSPPVAIITNLSPNHLDWHKDLVDYYEAKRNILRFQWPDDLAVLNAEDPVLRKWAEECSQRIALYAYDDPDWPNAAFIREGKVIVRMAGKEREAFALSGLKLPGRHNIMNALAATIASYMYLDTTAFIKEGIRSFKGLRHRLELVCLIKGKSFYNDSIATTPESAIAALNSFDNPKVIIAGGYDKGTEFTSLAEEILKNAAGAVLIGDTALKIKNELIKINGSDDFTDINIKEASSLEEAVKMSYEICPEGGVILLSPACASYDMFTNFQQRGDEFCRIVKELDN